MTQPHQYGPHVAQHAPNAVTVLCGGASTGQPIREEVRELPPQLVVQRERINELARQRAAGEGTMHDCAFMGRPVWLPADTTRDGGAWCPLCHSSVAAS